MRSVGDFELLDVLGAALASPPMSPDADEIAALRAMVTGRDDNVVISLPATRPARHPVNQVATVAAAVIALVVLGGLVAVSTGAPVPRALRSPARALGLPVDSADLADARTAMANLRTALAQPDNARVVVAADALVAHFRRLGANDRAAIEVEALALLARADERLQTVDIADAASAVREPSGGDPPIGQREAAPAPTDVLTEPAPAPNTPTTPTTPTSVGHPAGASDSGAEADDPPTATTVKHPADSSDSAGESEDLEPTTAPAEPETESPDD